MTIEQSNPHIRPGTRFVPPRTLSWPGVTYDTTDDEEMADATQYLTDLAWSCAVNDEPEPAPGVWVVRDANELVAVYPEDQELEALRHANKHDHYWHVSHLPFGTEAS